MKRQSLSVTPYHGAAHANDHDRACGEEMARRIARIAKGWPAGEAAGDRLWIPQDVLSPDEAGRLGIRDETQLYGGVAPEPFIATKIISHGLISPDAAAPPGWAHRLAADLEGAVLHGFSVFSLADARKAGEAMLAQGPIRLKDVKAKAGHGQIAVSDAAGLQAALADVDPDLLAVHGLVIEENLEDVITYSVGSVRLLGQAIAYWGTQRLTTNNHGAVVYGGSQLHVVRGGMAALRGQGLAPELAEAVDKAAHYDRMVFAAFPGLFASRRNYDVASGRDARGDRRTGVLEQSWRPGGASGAEIAALEAFARDPELGSVTCATMEVYGEVDAAPPWASLYYSGVDPVAGPLTKYVVVE